MRFLSMLSLVVLLCCCSAPVVAQYSTINNPFNTTNGSFFENMGVGFGFNIPVQPGSQVIGIGPGGQPTPNGSIGFNQGGAGAAQPPFGNFAPGSGGQAGFAVSGNDLGFNMNMNFGQGFQGSNVSQTPSVTIPNGGTGFVSDTTIHPFVISVIPVVGGGGFPLVGGGLQQAAAFAPPTSVVPGFIGRQLPSGGPSRLQQALQNGALQSGISSSSRTATSRPTPRPVAQGANQKFAAAASSSAGQAAASLDAIRHHQATEDAAQTSEAISYLRRGQEAEAAGKLGVAKIYYRMGLKRAAGETKDLLQARLDVVSRVSPK